MVAIIHNCTFVLVCPLKIVSYHVFSVVSLFPSSFLSGFLLGVFSPLGVFVLWEL
jgi:hypothetical protein